MSIQEIAEVLQFVIKVQRQQLTEAFSSSRNHLKKADKGHFLENYTKPIGCYLGEAKIDPGGLLYKKHVITISGRILKKMNINELYIKIALCCHIVIFLTCQKNYHF